MRSRFAFATVLILTIISGVTAGVALESRTDSAPSNVQDFRGPKSQGGNPELRARLDAHDAAVKQAGGVPNSIDFPAPPPITDTPARTEGIDPNFHAGPFSLAEFAATGTYQGPQGSVWTLVFAGQSGSVPEGRSAGALRVYHGPLDLSKGGADTYIGEFYAPGANKLEFVSVKGNVAILVDKDSGTQYQFDLIANSFMG